MTEDKKKTSASSLKDFIVSWNLRFKHDRWWRKKYNIAFGSIAHREMNQVDIYLDLLEDRLFDKARTEHEGRELKKQEYEKGVFLKEKTLSPEEEDKLFKEIKLF